MSFTHRQLYEKWKERGPISLDNFGPLIQYVSSEVKAPDVKELHDSITAIGYKIHARWAKSSRVASRFEAANKEWLNRLVVLKSTVSKTGNKLTTKRGAPEKEFNSVTPRQKKRRVAHLKEKACAEELAYAAELKLRENGKEDAAKLVHEAALTSPTRPSKLREALRNPKQNIINHTPEEALSLYLDLGCSKRQYQFMRNSFSNHRAPDFVPTYSEVKSEMDKCIPHNILVTEEVAEVKLQDLLDHTASRIAIHQRDVLEKVLKEESVKDGIFELVLEGKYGFDGSSGHSNYKQNFSNLSLDDSSIFMSSYSPLKLAPKSAANKLVWYNIKASSPRFCRPVRLRFQKETTELSLLEKKAFDREIESLVPTVIESGEVQVQIHHALSCTMIDGKVCSALTGKSVQRCPICGAYPREFHDLPALLKKEVSQDALSFGLSPLHFGIRAMECLLHISYRIDFQSTAARTPEQKTLMRFRKGIVQEDFKEKMALVVDMPKQGCGSSNDGNTARRFFKDP